MNNRIQKLLQKTLSGEMYVEPTPTEYDRTDLFLSPVLMSGKRVCEYIDNQDLMILEESCFTGFMSFDGSVEGDIFARQGHKNFDVAKKYFYNKPVNNLLTFEWQHSVGDFEKIIKSGITKIIDDIEKSKEVHKDDQSALEFLSTQTQLCNSILKRAEKGSQKALKLADTVSNEEYKKNLIMLSNGLKNIPKKPAESFYEAILCLYFCYSFIPDSIGLIDRYLYPYYKKDTENGTLTYDRAKEYLQELLLMLQGRIPKFSSNFYRGGESHFCVGGYLENGEDGFNELSRLIVDSLMELPTCIPQISLRWTKKTPSEVLHYMLDKERNDPNKRIAFVNDEPRIKGIMNHNGLSFKDAVNYTMIGCNEVALPGGMELGFDPINIVRCVENTFYNRRNDITVAKNFDEFYEIFRQELFSDLDEAESIGKKLQDIRSRDCNIVSNIFLEGCIENAKSCTQGVLTRYLAMGDLIGISNLIDSLSVTKQFVYDEKTVPMSVLIDALENNWSGYEDLRNMILKRGDFFGNDTYRSNEIAKRVIKSINEWNSTETYLKRKWLFGNLIGYNEHNKFFGNNLKATPDGRFAGDAIAFGLGQSEGKDRSGITALLNSVARCDPDAVLTGPSVTNILIDESLIRNDDSFNKLVWLFETYFKNGGTHFQLTYVSKEDLINAKKTPEKYNHIRVRVSGFSDYFNNLNDALQDEIITRTTHTK